jgi:hypothetical protein
MAIETFEEQQGPQNGCINHYKQRKMSGKGRPIHAVRGPRPNLTYLGQNLQFSSRQQPWQQSSGILPPFPSAGMPTQLQRMPLVPRQLNAQPSKPNVNEPKVKKKRNRRTNKQLHQCMQSLYAYLLQDSKRSIQTFCQQHSEGYDATRECFNDRLKLKVELEQMPPLDNHAVQSKLNTIYENINNEPTNDSPDKPPLKIRNCTQNNKSTNRTVRTNEEWRSLLKQIYDILFSS